MNEIEVKARLRNKEEVMKHLQDAGLEIETSKYQKDTVFFPNDVRSMDQDMTGKNFVRIREEKKGDKKKIIFTLKQPTSNKLNKREHEIEIQEKDIPEIFSMFELLGFYKCVVVEKNRTKAKIGDIEVCLDEVTGLGSFIELEKFAPSEHAEKIQQELLKMLQAWGVSPEDRVNEGYDILVYKAEHK